MFLSPDLHEIAKRLPSNAKYTNLDVQNEVAEILSEIVKETVATRVGGSKLYTIMMYGSTNKNGDWFSCALYSQLKSFVKMSSVMSGEFNGVNCVYCDRPVVYIHCYCHRLHLVVIAVLASILAIVSSLYNMFYLHKVNKMYTDT